MSNTMPIYQSPVREKNEEKYGTLSTKQCICCMKPMKPGETLRVHMNTDWLAVDPTIKEEDCKTATGSESQGCFEIGNSCAKHMKGFVF